MNKCIPFLRFSVLIILVVFCSTLYSQPKHFYTTSNFSVLDSAQYEITYKVEIVNNPQNPDDKVTDIQKLQLGSGMSKTYSDLLYQNDSVASLFIKENQNYPSPPKEATMYQVYKDYMQKNITVTYRSDEEIFRYKEPYPDFQWVMTNEKKTIMTYPCQKTTLDFRGRAYEAWFSPILPFSDGPFKFSGLPGLILEMQDSKKHYVFKCIGIKKLKTPKVIKIRKWDYTETKREKLHAFLKKKYSNLTEYYNARGITFGTKVDGKVVINPKNYSIPFNPIELE